MIRTPDAMPDRACPECGQICRGGRGLARHRRCTHDIASHDRRDRRRGTKRDRPVHAAERAPSAAATAYRMQWIGLLAYARRNRIRLDIHERFLRVLRRAYAKPLTGSAEAVGVAERPQIQRHPLKGELPQWARSGLSSGERKPI